MARSKTWWWGLPLLALLWLAANWIKTPEVEQDLRTRVGSASDSTSLSVAGRDVTLPIASPLAHAAAERTPGVRQVLDPAGDPPTTPDAGGSAPSSAPPEPEPPQPAAPMAPIPAAPVEPPQVNPADVTADLDAQACEAQFSTLLSQQKVLFDTAQDRLSSASQAALDALLAIARQCPGERIEVIGYSDSVGDADFNLVLSQRRAEAVVGYLAEHGIASENLKASGSGETHPLASNDTAEGQAANRRIEIKVTSNSAVTPPPDAQ